MNPIKTSISSSAATISFSKKYIGKVPRKIKKRLRMDMIKKLDQIINELK